MNGHTSIRSLLLLGSLLLAAILVAACGGGDATASGAVSLTPQPPSVRGNITVFAASSLTDAFNEIGKAFAAANPQASVSFNFASSSSLVTQINEGAPADVFAAADPTTMKAVTDKQNASNPRSFATNVPVVVVPKSGSPVQSFADLAKPNIKLVLAAPEVPVGNYARQVLTNASATGGIAPDFSARVLANLKSNEANVRAVLAKIQVGEADAGIVYSTDAATVPNDVRIIAIPTQYNVIATYPIATVTSSKNPATAAGFVDFVLSPAGQAILSKFGFGKATP